MLHCFKQL